MKLLSFFKKKEDPLLQMSKQEKRLFLTNDLIERMVRIEQQVAANFGHPIHFRKTNYYLKLTQKEKDSFESYLKNKKYSGLISALLLGLFFFSFNYSLTGNVISPTGDSIDDWPRAILFVLTVIFLVIFIFVSYFRVHRRKRLNRVHELVKVLKN